MQMLQDIFRMDCRCCLCIRSQLVGLDQHPAVQNKPAGVDAIRQSKAGASSRRSRVHARAFSTPANEISADTLDVYGKLVAIRVDGTTQGLESRFGGVWGGISWDQAHSPDCVATDAESERFHT